MNAGGEMFGCVTCGGKARLTEAHCDSCIAKLREERIVRDRVRLKELQGRLPAPLLDSMLKNCQAMILITDSVVDVIKDSGVAAAVVTDDYKSKVAFATAGGITILQLQWGDHLIRSTEFIAYNSIISLKMTNKGRQAGIEIARSGQIDYLYVVEIDPATFFMDECNRIQAIDKASRAQAPSSVADPIEQIRGLRGLLDEGIITQKDFDEKKDKLLKLI